MLSHAYNIAIDCGVGAHGHGKYVVDGLNANEKSFLTMLMTTVQLPGTATNKSQMVIHTSMNNTYISLAREFQKNISDPTRTHGLIDHRKYREKFSNHKWTEREYHVQDRKDVQQKSVKMSCASTQFQTFLFYGPHTKPHGVRGPIKHYHLQLEPKLVHGKCSIRRIPYV